VHKLLAKRETAAAAAAAAAAQAPAPLHPTVATGAGSRHRAIGTKVQDACETVPRVERSGG